MAEKKSYLPNAEPANEPVTAKHSGAVLRQRVADTLAGRFGHVDKEA